MRQLCYTGVVYCSNPADYVIFVLRLTNLPLPAWDGTAPGC